jgi:hypothetical protein
MLRRPLQPGERGATRNLQMDFSTARAGLINITTGKFNKIFLFTDTILKQGEKMGRPWEILILRIMAGHQIVRIHFLTIDGYIISHALQFGTEGTQYMIGTVLRICD